MYDVIEVSEYILHKIAECDCWISNQKLQALLYFVQAEFLVAKGTPCFPDEIVIYGYGICVKKSYFKYNIFGFAGIPIMDNEYANPFSKKDKRLVDGIIKKVMGIDRSGLQWLELIMNQDPYILAKERFTWLEDDKIVRKEDIKEFFTE